MFLDVGGVQCNTSQSLKCYATPDQVRYANSRFPLPYSFQATDIEQTECLGECSVVGRISL